MGLEVGDLGTPPREGKLNGAVPQLLEPCHSCKCGIDRISGASRHQDRAELAQRSLIRGTRGINPKAARPGR